MYLTLFAVFYSMWSLNSINGYTMILTTPLVLIILIRYTYSIENNEDGDPTELIYHDKILWFLGAVYLILIVLIIYFPEIINECLRF